MGDNIRQTPSPSLVWFLYYCCCPSTFLRLSLSLCTLLSFSLSSTFSSIYLSISSPHLLPFLSIYLFSIPLCVCCIQNLCVCPIPLVSFFLSFFLLLFSLYLSTTSTARERETHLISHLKEAYYSHFHFYRSRISTIFCQYI